MQHPGGSFNGVPYNLGDYDQCLQVLVEAGGVNTQYCLAEVKLTRRKHKWENRNVMSDTEAFLGTTTNLKRDLSKLTWGVCLPEVCQSRSAAKILKAIYMVNPIMAAEPSIQVEHCQVAGAKREITAGFYAFVITVLALISCAVFSTIYTQSANPNLISTLIVQCFCLKQNWLSLTKKSRSDDISIFSAFKVVLAALALISHSFYFMMGGPVSNVYYFDTLLSSACIKRINLGIEIFLMISGILLIKGLLTTEKHPLVLLTRRYFRLIGSFSIVVFYVAAVSMYTGDGPLWQKMAGREQKASFDNWLWSLLMLNNFINSESISQIVAWHTPCDYQLAIMGTIIFMLWRKDYRLGKMVTILVSVLAMIIPALCTYCMNLPSVVLYDDVQALTDFRKNKVYLEIYIKCYCMAVPYLIGMGMGYIMTVYKPHKYRQSLPLVPALVLFTSSVIILHRILTATIKTDRLSTAVSVPYEKIVFSLAICTIFGVIEYGSLPVIRRASEFHGFTVLNRLVYGVYLTHSLFLQQNSYSRRYVQEFRIFSTVTYALGVFILSVALSVLLWLFVEAPLSNLVNLVTSPRSVPVNENNEKSQILIKQEITSYDKIIQSKIEKIKDI